MDNKETKTKKDKERTSLVEFFQFVPPGKFAEVKEVIESVNTSGYRSYYLPIPEIYIFCKQKACNGDRFYKPDTNSLHFSSDRDTLLKFVEFTCKNCQKEIKLFSLYCILAEDKKSASILKFGEYPPYGQPTPAKLIELIGPDKESFLMGRKCENQGLGIGAFTYYRRVIESQKNRIFDKIIEVAKKVASNKDIIQELETAKSETQFSKGVQDIKHAIPESLLIDGHNPLTLLYKALSEGVHDKTDEECLELASSIRTILAELSQKAAQVLKNDAEVSSALSKLLNRKK